MKHRHNTGPVKYRTKRGRIKYRKRPMHKFRLKSRQSLFHAGNEPPSEMIKKGKPVYGFSSPDFAEAWKSKMGYGKIYQFQTDRYALDPKSYLRDTPLGKRISEPEFIAGNIIEEQEI